MQGEEFKEISFEHNMMDDFLLDELYLAEEQKQNSVVGEMAAFAEEGEKKPVNRGKGRPKGEKNSKTSEKKGREGSSLENCKKGHWSLEENKRYHWFLEIYHKHFICKEMRRLDKIFKTMANFIGTREAEQCRSHHQKMEKKHFSFPSILLFLRRSHYTTEDPHSIYEDLVFHEVTETAVFLSRQELEEINLQKDVPPTPTMTQIAPEAPARVENDYYLNKEISFCNSEPFEDILRDNYEEQLNLENFLF